MKVLDRTTMDKEDVRHLNEAQLTRLGIRIINRSDLVLQCIACGEHWTPQLDSGGHLPFDYWICPANCNR